ncbi:MAG: hypothetical protein KDC53_01730 [Saprospiraceae bacterium]|nr:hypothetical protein [Saprospiraceae bacterium]
MNLIFIHKAPLSMYTSHSKVLLPLFLLIVSFQLGKSQESSYIATDRDIYRIGQKIYYTVYVADLLTSDEEGSPGIYFVELINPNGKVLNRRNTLIKHGTGQSYINLADTLTPGIYWLRGFRTTPDQSGAHDKFSRPLYLLNTISESLDFQWKGSEVDTVLFFPEGGMLIADQPCRVITLGLNKEGLPCPLQGTILSSEGTVAATISPQPFGLAEFTLIPQKGRSYSLEYIDHERQKTNAKLPEILIQVRSIHLSPEEDQLQLNIVNAASSSGPVTLVISSHSEIWSKKVLASLPYQEKYNLIDLPAGLITFSLINDNFELLSERLYYNHKEINRCYFDVSSDMQHIDSVNYLGLTFEFYNEEGLPCPPTFEIKLTREEITPKNNFNIKNYLAFLQWLDIKNSSFQFFDPDIFDSDHEIVDRFLITQHAKLNTAEYSPEPSSQNPLSISGTVLRKNKPWKTSGFFSTLDNLLNLQEWQTDAAGKFTITNLEVYDTSDVVFMFNDEKQKNNTVLKIAGNSDIRVYLDSVPLPEKVNTADLYLPSLLSIDLRDNQPEAYSSLPITLDEVQIKAKKIDALISYYQPSMLYTQPDDRVFFDESIPNKGTSDVIDILKGRVTSFIVTGEGGNGRQVIMRGRSTGLSRTAGMSNAAEFTVNGSPVSLAYAESINPVDIAFVDIIRSLSLTSVYGEFGRNGIIAIYLKPPHQRKVSSPKESYIISKLIVGYAKPIDFSPAQSGKDDTIYWSGIVRANQNGEADFRIPIPKINGNYILTVEGLTGMGTPLHFRQSIDLK